ncbi:MAG: DegT/DnrJ/EryC1/StrS family aminotransferase [Rhodanobacter sp.]
MNSIVPVNALDRHIAPLSETLQRAAADVIASGYYVLGPQVKAFESEFAAWCGVDHCVSVANGTEALELGLRSLGIKRDTCVALVGNAAMYGTTATLACGAEPVFVDVDPVTLLMDPKSLEAILATRTIDVVIVTHLYGRLADMPPFLALAQKHGFAIFEDCAQAHGAADAAGRKAGSFGQAASFSFYPTKNLGALGDGGAVITADPNTANRLRQLRQYGWAAKYRNELAGGRNSRLDEIQASFLRVLLPHVGEWNARRRDIANRYSREIRHTQIAVPAPSGDEFVAHLYVARTGNRAGLQAHLTEAGIASEVHYPLPDYRQPLFGDLYAGVTLPVTEDACGKVITLPCFPELTDDEVTRVIEACNRW